MSAHIFGKSSWALSSAATRLGSFFLIRMNFFIPFFVLTVLCGGCTDSILVQPSPFEYDAAVAAKYDKQLIAQPPNGRGKDDGWYIVMNGKRQWVLNPGWLSENGFPDHPTIISSKEFYSIEENPTPIK